MLVRQCTYPFIIAIFLEYTGAFAEPVEDLFLPELDQKDREVKHLS